MVPIMINFCVSTRMDPGAQIFKQILTYLFQQKYLDNRIDIYNQLLYTQLVEVFYPNR